MAHNFDLLFLEQNGRSGSLLGPPIAHVYARNLQTVEYPVEQYKGAQLLTPRCHSLNEIEYEIDRLQKELEAIRTTARSKFRNSN